MTVLPLAKALNAALDHVLSTDRRTLVMGEDVGALGGVFRVTDGLFATHGADRVVDTPLGEAGIVGTAVGLCFRGYRPILEIQFDGFVFPAFNQITTQVAKMNNRTDGRTPMQMVIRIPYGGGIGAIEHHSESPEALFAHTAGLRIVTPANASDGYWMLRQAVASKDPVIFLEPKRRYWEKSEVDLEAGEAPLPLHAARIARPGTDATVVAWGPMVATALQSAEAAAQDGIDLEVIDLRSLSPLDVPTIVSSVRRTGRLIVAHEAPVFGGLGGEIAARISEACFYHLEAPVLRIGGFHLPYPPARSEEEYLPDLDRLLDGVDRVLAY